MRIALDFDDTITRDQGAWFQFTNIMRAAGHSVTVVTSRKPTYDNSDIEAFLNFCNRQADLPVINVVYCYHKAKRKYCRDRGLEFDVWIDDMPEFICFPMEQWQFSERVKLYDDMFSAAEEVFSGPPMESTGAVAP